MCSAYHVGYTVYLTVRTKDLHDRFLSGRQNFYTLKSLDQRLVRRYILSELCKCCRNYDTNTTCTGVRKHRLQCFNSCIRKHAYQMELVYEQNDLHMELLYKSCRFIEQSLDLNSHLIVITKIGYHLRNIYLKIYTFDIRCHRALNKCCIMCYDMFLAYLKQM